MEWEPSKFHVQVLDDSTDAKTRELVDEKVEEWKERGVSISCLRRTNRQGYKAGAMKEGMDILSAKGYKYVAVFDADFRPEADFLMRTIPYLEGNSTVGYVQTRWVFTNPDESYLTKAQEVSLNYHMKCEQYTHSATGSFFNFNGTAGVWRLSCIEDAGGWNSRTTVEDMDLSLRAYVKGWKAIFLDDVTCLNELPASFFAFRKQQHRWTCGPVQLWSKASKDIWSSSLPLLRKLELICVYFGIRKCATHFVALGFFCTLVPLSVFTPEISIPTWVLVHLPILVTISTAGFTPKGWVYSILYVLFENAMGLVKLWAVITALLDLKRAQEWVVTTKLGSSDKRPGTSKAIIPSCKVYGGELAMGLFLVSLGTLGVFTGHHWGLSSYMLIQGMVFVSFGFNMVDVGGLLGGRLDVEIIKVYSPLSTHPEVYRTSTVPIIQLNALGKSEEYLTSVESAPPSLTPYDGISRPPSPTHSASDSDNSLPSMASTASEGMSIISLDDKRSSPTSSLSNIYVKSSFTHARKGFRIDEARISEYV
jgi:beta-mannan synthase